MGTGIRDVLLRGVREPLGLGLEDEPLDGVGDRARRDGQARVRVAHNIDAKLAQLTYDSSSDQDTVAAVRSEAASIRALTFTSARLSIELEVAATSLVGRIIPPRAGALEVHTTAGVTSSPVDEIGCFVVDPSRVAPFGYVAARRTEPTC